MKVIEDSAQLVYLKLDPLSIASDISTLPADTNVANCADGSSTDESSSEDKAPLISLKRSARQKRPAPSYTVCNHNRGQEINLEICHLRASKFMPVWSS